MTEPDVVESVPVAEGVALHVRRWSGAGATPMVLVHGLASNARLWDGVAGGLAAQGHPVAAVDLRGHGRSSKPDAGYDLATVADDVRRLLDHLAGRGFDRPLLAGQSWGGNVVLELAARHPGLTGAVAGIDGGTIELRRRFPTWEACEQALRPPALIGVPRADIERHLRAAHPDWPVSGIEGQLACFDVREDGTVAPWLTLDRHLQVLRGLWDHRPSERYPLVREPVLLVGADTPDADPVHVAGKRDDLAAAASALRRARVEWMTGDHDLHAQHPAQVAALLAEHARAAREHG